MAVALFITSGYWFTSSTSFANPAVTISRMFTDTFTGIAPSSVVYFIIGQLIGALMGNILYNKIDSNWTYNLQIDFTLITNKKRTDFNFHSN